MIPPFDRRGLLPLMGADEPYRCSVGEVKQRLVTDRGLPEWRRSLFDGWDLLQRSVGVRVPSTRWWLWGCFVSDHAEPLDGEYQTVNALAFIPTVDLPPNLARTS